MSIDKVVKRDSNFELLRIVGMLFIILHHLVYHSNYQIGQLVGIDNFILTFFVSGGKLGGALFIMITGYYMVKVKDIKISKLVGLELQVLFYSLGIFVLFRLFSDRVVGLEEMFKILFPNISKSYCFFSSYFILYLFIPFLNRLINNINRKEFIKLLGTGFIFLILVPSIVIYNGTINEGIYLFYYYLIGAYIRLYCDDIKGGLKYLLGFIVFYLFIVMVTIFIGNLSYSNEVLINYVYAFSNLKSILLFFCSICLFLFFKGLKIGSNRIINYVASTSFGVYLFHEHMFMKELLWDGVFMLDKILGRGSILINGILVVFLVYMVGFIIELVRKGIFKYFFSLMEKFGWNKLFD